MTPRRCCFVLIATGAAVALAGLAVILTGRPGFNPYEFVLIAGLIVIAIGVAGLIRMHRNRLR